MLNYIKITLLSVSSFILFSCDQQEENYPTLSKDDIIDFDGIGNQGRVPNNKNKKKTA